MSRKPESRFIQRVHKHLPDWIACEKTNNPFVSGILDCYYEAAGNITLWIEYKWMPRLPQPPALLVADEIPHFTRLQQRSLRRKHANGVPAALAIGSPVGVVVRPGITWATPSLADPISFEQFVEWLQNRMEQTSSPPRTTTKRSNVYATRS